jgi:hypothetical protein
MRDRSVKEILSTMKFKIGMKVYVNKLPDTQSHFPQELEAEIDGTYEMFYGGVVENNKKYRLIFKDPVNNTVSWYDEKYLEEV